MTPLLEVHDLTKDFHHPWTFRRFRALRGLGFAVGEGELFGLIGYNGAGKTTTFKLVMGLLRPTRGEIRFAGAPLDRHARAAIGFLPEQPYFYDYLTVEETLDLYGRLYGLSRANRRRRIDAVIEEVGLGPKRRTRLGALSKGTLQRVGIAQAILHQPRLLILDEPMSGLDPVGRHQMRELIAAERRAGATVIFSSHILPDAESLCDRVGIIAGGELKEIVSLRDGGARLRYVVRFRNVEPLTLERIAALAAAAPRPNGGDWSVEVGDPERAQQVLDAVRAARGRVEEFAPVRPSLEKRFLQWLGPGDGHAAG